MVRSKSAEFAEGKMNEIEGFFENGSPKSPILELEYAMAVTNFGLRMATAVGKV